MTAASQPNRLAQGGLIDRSKTVRFYFDGAELTGYPGEIVFNDSKPDGMPKKLMDVRRAARLGWKAKVTIPEGLQLTYDWYLKNVSVETGAE